MRQPDLPLLRSRPEDDQPGRRNVVPRGGSKRLLARRRSAACSPRPVSTSAPGRDPERGGPTVEYVGAGMLVVVLVASVVTVVPGGRARSG